MKDIYKILGIFLIVVFVFWLLLHEMTKELNYKITTLEQSLEQEKQAAQKQIENEKKTADYYKKQYDSYIKDGDFCYNKEVELDVLKMLDEIKE